MMEDASQEKRRSYRARDFARSAMSCPSCQVVLNEAREDCPRCGFSGSVAVRRFPYPAPEMEMLIDPGGIFGDEDRAAVERGLERLRRYFPQVRLCFCVMELSREIPIREFAFWFFNASPVRDEEEAARRPWTVLILIDTEGRRVTQVAGYAVEPFLSDAAAVASFRKCRGALFQRRFPEVLVDLAAGVEADLWEGQRRAKRKGGRQ
ncbi:MAG: hypothetical protein ACQKBY_07965 [Verrucomicrobiales bacterium]